MVFNVFIIFYFTIFTFFRFYFFRNSASFAVARALWLI